jgi:penicillin-binding protein 1C
MKKWLRERGTGILPVGPMGVPPVGSAADELACPDSGQDARRPHGQDARATLVRRFAAMRRWLFSLGITAAVLGAGWLCLPEPPPLMADISYSTRVVDRDGRLLRLALSADDKYRLHTPLAEISPELISAALLQEDQHFRWHCGINPVAAVRATFHAALGHGGRGGASTITMQLARLRYRLHTKSAGGKLVQMWRALEIERHYTKQQILEDYLNVAPYGGNIEGIGAASLLYFNKPPAKLTAEEAVLLSVLPQSPTRRAPRAGADNAALLSAADRLAARRSARALAHPSLGHMREFTAPHFVRRVLASAGPAGEIRTTLDRDLQRMIERRVTSYLDANRASGLTNAAAMLVDTDTMEVLAQIGSANFGDETIAGQVDGTHSRRSPGSTLKPFIYAAAMDQGRIHPLTMLTDAPRRFAGYAPENFDGDFAGPLKATEALARSRNVPAVELAQRLVHPTFYELLKRGGVALPREESFYGLALPLGGGEVTMEELVRLYCALANGGRLRPLNRTLPHAPPAGGVRMFSPESAFLTLQMLGQVPRPDLSRLAGDDGVYWKTGTSMGFRDAWSVAVFDHYVLAVWIGNFDGRRNPAFVGRTCAGPLLFRVIDAMRLQSHVRPRPLSPPPGANLRTVQFCAISGQLPCASCRHRITGWFIPGISPITECEVHREILVDRETGLRVASDDGTRALRREIYEFWPSDLQALFERAGLPRRRPPPFAPGASPETTARTGKPPVIVSPATGRIYALNPGDETTGTMALQARCETDVARLYWFAGKDFLGSCAPRESLAWRPSPGLYRLVALDDRGRSSSSTVTLRSTQGE